MLGLGAIYAFPSLRPGLRSAVALLFGALAIVNGMLHVKHVADSGAAASDLTGVLAAVAGVVLVGLAIAIPWLHRGEGAGGARRRWAIRVLAIPLGLLAFFYTVVPMGIALTETHKYREAIGPAPAGGLPRGRFEATDGVGLSGWYRPTRNGATILVVHGGGGDRTGAAAHARLLVRHGYGVLLHDARGRGKSEGAQNSYGWGWPKDVAGAIGFLKARSEVDPERIGALGLSTGADTLIQVAGPGTDLKAVVADGTYAGSFEDGRRIMGIHALTPFMAVEFATVGVTSGTTPEPALEDVMERIAAPLLLVAAGPDERAAGALYDRAAGDRPVDVWYLPDVAPHGRHPAGRRRVRAARRGVLRPHARARVVAPRRQLSSSSRPASRAGIVSIAKWPVGMPTTAPAGLPGDAGHDERGVVGTLLRAGDERPRDRRRGGVRGRRRLGVGAQRVRAPALGEHGEHGVAVDAVLRGAEVAELLQRDRRDPPAIPAGAGGGAHPCHDRLGHEVEHRAAGDREERIEEHQARDALGCPVGRAGDHDAAVAEADEDARVGRQLRRQLLDVRGERGLWPALAEPLADPGQGGRRHAVAALLEEPGHAVPQPSARARPVHEHDRRHGGEHDPGYSAGHGRPGRTPAQPAWAAARCPDLGRGRWAPRRARCSGPRSTGSGRPRAP